MIVFSEQDLHKNIQIESLFNNHANCTLCRLASVVDGYDAHVFASGWVESELMFVAEAPGKDETIQKIPLCGAAGRNLEQYLFRPLGINRHMVWLSNICKCRPKGNREPEEDEKEICAQTFLYKEISIIRPKIIVALGKHALSKLTGETKIMKLSNQTLIANGFSIYPIPHPASLSYPNKYVCFPKYEKAVVDLKNILKIN